MKFELVNPDLGRLAAAVERLAVLYELDLISRGLVTRGADMVGEVLDTDEDQINRLEEEEEYRKKHGLPPGAPVGAGGRDGRGWRPGEQLDEPAEQPTDFFAPFTLPLPLNPPAAWYLGNPGNSSFTVGPEGAEEAEPGPEAERRE